MRMFSVGRRCRALLAVLAGLSLVPCRAEEALRTAAESSGYRSTSRYRDVSEMLASLARISPRAHLESLGESGEGRGIEVLVVADPPVSAPSQVRRDGRLVVLLVGGVHGGEVDGKDALLELARDLATAPAHPLLSGLVVAFVPLLNPDGNERIDPRNRSYQDGPEQGVGERHNAAGLDLNRDWVKVCSPEVRAALRFVRQWDPDLVVDVHTTDGSFHRYAVTYEGSTSPAADAWLTAYSRDTFLPAAAAQFRLRTGWEAQLYGNFDAERRLWETFPPLPRFGSVYCGLRGRLSVLVESYVYLSFADRVRAAREFVHATLEEAARRRVEIRELLRQVDERTTAAGRAGASGAGSVPIAVRARVASELPRARILGFEDTSPNESRRPTGEAREWDVKVANRFEAAREVPRPLAYVLPAVLSEVRERLEQHGVIVEELREDVEVEVEVSRIERAVEANETYQGRRLVDFESTRRRETRRLPAGALVVRTAQRLGSLAAYLLEPDSEDGLAAWGFFAGSIRTGSELAVLRVVDGVPLLTVALPGPDDAGKLRRRVTFDLAFGSERPPAFGGSPIGGLEWLADGEHYLQAKEGGLWKVHAVTGGSTRFVDPVPLARALSALPALAGGAGETLASSPHPRFDSTRRAVLFAHEQDLYYARVDGTGALRLTSTPDEEEVAGFSPDGKFVAFVRQNDLCVVDVETGGERALTTGGTDRVRHGKADWVYFEEVFNRDWKAHWWSPNSRRIAYLEVDSRPVRSFTLVDDVAHRQGVEEAPYPRPGEPNPLVRLGIVGVAGGATRWAELSDYDEVDVLVTAVGWWPDSKSAYVCVQNRVQTWLDFLSVPADGGKPTKLFRETTPAWVEALASPLFLGDGSFLVLSERSGWKHVYHYERDGRLRRMLTDGAWEVRQLHLADEPGGWLYVSGTRDSPRAHNLYRVRLDGSVTERLTHADGSHTVSVAPGGARFIDSWSSLKHPRRTAVAGADGTHMRWVDTNPAPALDAHVRVEPEVLQIPTADGFLLEATLLRPPNLDPTRRYPVWVLTYGGPHTQTVWNVWGSQWAWDQVLVQSGIVVLRVDPRSASGKGAVSTWTCYKRLGVRELADLEEVVLWLKAQPYVDAARIGLSGHSYGGFLTAFALSRSRSFAAGVSGAPVTDWRLYDTIYTERYMLTPQLNPEGYEATSVIKAAGGLTGRLLLLHGDMDDNVHTQNSWQWISALQRHGKQFELMVYPGARHGLGGRHYQRLMYDFILRSLGVQAPADEPAAGATGARRQRL